MPYTRTAAAIVALSAWAGLVLQWIDFLSITANKPRAALGEMLMYFTIFTNLVTAAAFTTAALGHTVAPWLIGGIMLSIVLVAVIYAALLSDLPLPDTPTAALSNTLVHRTTPALVILFWIVCVPKGTLHWTDAAWWVAYPTAYTAYALIRGAITSRYPYAFLDAQAQGWPATFRNAAGIAVAFITLSLILIAIDRLSRTS